MSTQDFLPPRRRGRAIHATLILLLLAASSFSFWNASREDVGAYFVIFLLIGVCTFAALPFLAYQLYALQRARYRLDRDTLVLRWGLRLEELPLDDIEWVRPASDLTVPLALPRLNLPGSILGLRRHPDLGMVEFLASDKHNLLLIATTRRVFAISPENPSTFTHEFQRSVELGSLEHAKGRSIYPSFVITRAWGNPLARFLWVSGLLMNIGLLAWVSLLIPSLSQVRLGFDAAGRPFEPVAAVQLIILPLINLTLFAAGWLTGLYYYRRPEQRMLSFSVWSFSTLTSLVFIVAALANLLATG